MLLFAELESTATGQTEAFLGTPGTLTQRSNDNGTRFWVHRYSDAVGRRLETYLGKADEISVLDKVAGLRERIDAANATIARVRVLARSGFATADRKTYATFASLHNHGLFHAGALLIGSHAYGVLLNVLGVKAVPYATEDVDIARREQLALTGITPFLKMLRETGIQFFEIPSLKRRDPPTSYAEPGGSRLKVDLLVPSSDESCPTIEVPELKAHAQGLPYLRYLLGKSQEAALLSPYGVIAVRVPVPERYALHKLLVSQLRGTLNSKAAKDLRQAATLIEAVVDRFPGAVEDARAAIPKGARRHIRRALLALEHYLPESKKSAWEELK